MIDFHVRHRFDDFELDLEFRSEARTLALFGHSGAGKTCALNAIAGLFAPEAARIEIDGRCLVDTRRGICVPVAARRIGYVFQDDRLFPHLNVRRNLVYGDRRDRTVSSAAFDAIVELLDLRRLLERRPDALSGGERRRVAIGRALLAAPDALLLDEPLSGLHAEARMQVLDHLGCLKRELAVFTVLVSHHADEVAALADEVVRIADGRVARQLDITEFVARRAVVAAALTDDATALPDRPNSLG